SGSRMKVATSPKRGTTVPATGWGKSLMFQQRLAGNDELLDRSDESIGFGLADHDVESDEAAPRDPDAGREHVKVEQFLGVLVACRNIRRGTNWARRGMGRHHRADAGELKRHLLARADLIEALADPLTPLVELPGGGRRVDLAVAGCPRRHGEGVV